MQTQSFLPSQGTGWSATANKNVQTCHPRSRNIFRLSVTSKRPQRYTQREEKTLNLEDLFLSEVSEMRDILETWKPYQFDAEYKLLRIAALLRQMITDQKPLIHQIRKTTNTKSQLVFPVNKNRTLKPSKAYSAVCWLNPFDEGTQIGTPIEEDIEQVSLENFLSIPIVCIKGSKFTVKEVIKYFSNAHGAIHREETLSAQNIQYQPFRDAENEGQRIDGCPPGLSSLKIISGIFLSAIDQIESDVRNKRTALYEELEKKIQNDGYL